MTTEKTNKREARTFFRRLSRDVRGNTLAMMAVFLIPLSALTGSAVDIGRQYLVKVRLQQACDAGALAGRKFMADDNNTTLDANAATQAKTFFANNFPSGIMGSTPYTAATNPYPFVPVKTPDKQVSGTATTQVPMTIMKMFGQPAQTITVTCEARYDIADTDVMFVLDNTGSMADKPDGTGGGSIQTYTRPDGTTGYYVQEASGSKISGLRAAVLNFYDTVAANADPSTHVRYGFVTYTSAVNSGYAVTAVSSNYIVNSWSYQTRRIVGDNILRTNSSSTVAATSLANCMSNYSRTPATSNAVDAAGNAYTVYPFNTSGTASAVDPSWNSAKNICTLNNDTITPIWRYAKFPFDTSQLKLGSTIDDPSKITAATSKWQGCVEERDTTASSSFDPTNLPPDLDPDLIPTNDSTRWRPMWSDVVYYRGNTAGINYAGNSTNPYGDSTSTSQIGQYTALNMYNNIAYGYVSCGKPVQRLAVLSRTDMSNYVNAPDFVPQGGTYHDTGMIWGTRMLSPAGIFAADTAAWPGRNPPNRYIVFMTDGDMSPSPCIYGMYGIENYDQRVTNGSYTSNCSNTANPNQMGYHNARFLAECQAAKNRNIIVFVIGFGQTLTPQLTTCASPNSAYYASDNASLNTAFQQIAKQVAMLRVSK